MALIEAVNSEAPKKLDLWFNFIESLNGGEDFETIKAWIGNSWALKVYQLSLTRQRQTLHIQ